MTPRKLLWARRVAQAGFFALFVWLFLGARLVGANTLPARSTFFFNIDPLVMVGTWLATHTIPRALLLALVTVAATIVLGRVFCGWVCPLGAIHHFTTWCAGLLRKTRRKTDPFVPWQRAKYYLLAALLVMAAFGSHWFGVLDPFSVLYRSMSTAVYPAAQYAVEDASTAMYQSDPGIGPVRATLVTEPVYRFFRDRVFVTTRGAYDGSVPILALFIGIVALNFHRKRFWCRYVCPLGAMLGVFSRRPALRLKNTDNECNQCGLCALECPAAAQPDKPGEWLPTECFECWNCVNACRREAIDFGFGVPFTRATQGKLDVSKRALVGSAAGGVGALLMMRLTPRAQAKTYNAELIRPPGSRHEREFLQRCIQCGLCMKVCPTNALHPTFMEAGLEGIWTPRLIPKVGYCEYECNLCGQACPTGAIELLPLEEKRRRKIGLAAFDTTRCLPHAYGRDCIICEEHCPVSPKAIYVLDEEVTQPDGSRTTVKKPYVAADRCIGCGICENKCVFMDQAAVRVTSANEDRHPDNRPILSGWGSQYGGGGPYARRRRTRSWAGRQPPAGDGGTCGS